jgi:outer membrane protein assembly factor BamB
MVDDKLIVNPGGAAASLAALDRLTGKIVWQTPGEPPGYAAFVLAELGGVRQVVGYDLVSLGGWNPDTGKRLWRLEPEYEGDFNVPTPIVVGDKLLVSTENNGTRLYGFDAKGRIGVDPLAENEDLAPDTSTPVVHRGLVLGNYGGLVCLDANDGLKTLWESEEDPFVDYCSFIAGGGRVLVTSQLGRLSLIEADGKGLVRLGEWDLFDDVPDAERDVWSHPALVDGRLYVRNLLAVYCFLID